MEASDLRATCLSSNAVVVQISTKDVKKAYEKLAMWNSSAEDSRESRRKFMAKYIPDIAELST